MKVLVVDDEPMIREILVERLGMHGPEIVEAGNGVEGLALLAHAAAAAATEAATPASPDGSKHWPLIPGGSAAA